MKHRYRLIEQKQAEIDEMEAELKRLYCELELLELADDAELKYDL